MLSWRKMGRVLILLTLVLALANGRCFAHCVVQPCGSETTHCHPQGHANAGQCSHQHDMMAAGLADVVAPPSSPSLQWTPSLLSPNDLDPSPPTTTNLIPPLPLRV
jgi:hypothetical protein